MSPRILSVQTKKHSQFIDITGDLTKMVSNTDIEEGICYIYVPHTTAAITINENADQTVQRDIIKQLEELIPWENNFFKHIEGNSAAHIKASLLGSSCSVIINEGKLLLGTWQGIYFCEFDGPRNRNVYVKIANIS